MQSKYQTVNQIMKCAFIVFVEKSIEKVCNIITNMKRDTYILFQSSYILFSFWKLKFVFTNLSVGIS